MDNVNTGPVNPDDPRPDDIARPGPTDPNTGQPDHGAEATAIKGWLRENAVSLVISAVLVALDVIFLDPIDTLKVVVGLGFIIFIHELGHFLAAKWCDVHVRTFSIGFGPAVPFCSYKWGETTYMIGIIPLGGYVAMVGENEEEEGEEDPRSFRKKTVGQRMLIISAGVVMNVILGLACFTAAYLHGVQEKPATVGYVESGGAAWRAGMRTGDHITKIGSRDNPYFDDLRPIVMSSRKDEQVPIQWERNGVPMPPTTVSPIRDEGQRFPQLGISPPSQLTLLSGNKKNVKATYPGTPAAAAAAGNGEKFEPGDRVVAMTDPKNPKGDPTPVADYDEYHRRMVLLAAEPVTFQVLRKGQEGASPLAITVKPAYRHDPGMRMRMGEVAALRAGGSAEQARVVAHAEGSPPTRGDRIKAVLLPANREGVREWFVAGLDFAKYPDKGVDFTKPEFKTDDPVKVRTAPLDPLLLPRQLSKWAADNGKDAKFPVEVVLLRPAHPADETVKLALEYDPSFRFDREAALQPNSPQPLSALGLAYWVEAVVDEVAPDGPAAAAGVQPNDVITAVRFKAVDDTGALKEGAWKDDLKSHQWASADAVYQLNSPELGIRVMRNNETKELSLQGRASTWALEDRGLIFQAETQIQKASDVGDAIRLGGLRTVRFIKTVYMNLYAMAIGRVSAKTMSGPLTIANVSYKLAGEDFWQFLLFLGMISVNLAVVNFLPIPVLDGGHMVFLILEKILGRPVPERLFAFAMYAGLFLILSLMVFVLFLDVGRLFFGAF
ncbi:MAG: RIP metalloprotease RseP [Planctomycetes bacterium]|nr:RIP metalloprotease RseP [Planctomycetota bacterium]